MKTIFFFLTFALVFNGSNGQLPTIKVRGNAFVDDNLKRIVFKGLNTSDPDKLEKEGHWNAEYFDEIKSWGANIVRFPIHPRAWRSRGKEGYLKILDDGISMASDRNLYVIIDWHSIGNLRTELFQAKGYETDLKETMEFWSVMAERYKDESTILGFELFNEPTTGNGKYGTCTWLQWKEIMEEIIGVIRAYGNQKPVLVAGFNWAYDLTSVIDNPIEDSQIAYVSHPYPQKRAKPWQEKWELDWGHVSDHYPIILTEIGFCAAGDVGAHIPVITDDTYGTEITAYAKKKGISYVAWVFDPSWAPRMFEDWSFKPSSQGKFFKEALRSE